MKNNKLKITLAAALFVVLTSIHAVRSGVTETYSQIKLLVDVMQHIKEQYVEQSDQTKLVYGAAEGMVGTLDPFSQFMPPEAHKEMRTETEGEFGGLGIRIAIRDGWLTVMSPMPDTPAYRQGILAGDRIIKIEGEVTQGITTNEAVEKLRGRPKTKVTITILREGEEPKDYTITREVIHIQSVKWEMKEGNVGYVRLAEFIETSAQDMAKALKELSSKGMTSLVLDLRNNPGGLLVSAVDISRMFLGGRKLIVYTQGRTSPRQEFAAEAEAPYGDINMVVLVNHGSASGSEIVAGCLQDHKRAVILGSETFGKASVQSIIGLDDGSALRLTTARYYTPLGRMIHRDEKTKKGGITPDIVMDIPKEMEAKLYMQSEEVYSKNKKPQSAVKPEEQVKDEVLLRAVELLKAQAIFGKIKKI